MMPIPLPVGPSGPTGDPAPTSPKEMEAMMGRTPDARTFPAVLLAFASLSTPALGATPGDTEAAGAIASAPGGTVVGDAAPVERESEDSGISAALALLAPTEDLVRRGEVLPDGVGDVLSTVDVAAGEAVLDEHAGDGEGASRTGAVDLSTHGDTVTLDSRLLHNLRGDFVARLERVAERMWDQHGMRVELVEGYRTPERQQALFAQGRTTDGPVVTWTRNSLHSVGAAADVFVDGSPVTPEEAALLARVAREEGLRTLHPFDSGHIQMEGVGSRGGPESALPR